jgi:hypothetical protein
MRLDTLARQLGLENLTPELGFLASSEIVSGHASDLLSDVLANAPEGGVLVTIQSHLNVLAVSVHAGIRAVIFTAGMIPEASVRDKAVAEQVLLYSTRESTFDVVGRLYALGLRGAHA